MFGFVGVPSVISLQGFGQRCPVDVTLPLRPPTRLMGSLSGVGAPFCDPRVGYGTDSNHSLRRPCN